MQKAYHIWVRQVIFRQIVSLGIDVIKGVRNNEIETIDLRGKCPNP
jgi:hypothetical protein